MKWSLRAIYNATGNVTLLREFLPALVASQLWWQTTRMPDGDDLVTIVHGWESGLDASPVGHTRLGMCFTPKSARLFTFACSRVALKCTALS